MLAGEPSLNNSAANKKKNAALLTPWQTQGAQLALCNFYTTRYLSLDICWLNPKWNKCAFFPFFFSSCSRINDSLMLRPTLSFLYLGCVVASPLPLCSARLFPCATPLHFALTPAAVHPNPLYPTLWDCRAPAPSHEDNKTFWYLDPFVLHGGGFENFA